MFLKALLLAILVVTSFDCSKTSGASSRSGNDMVAELELVSDVLSENQNLSINNGKSYFREEKLLRSVSDYNSSNMVNYNLVTNKTTFEYFDQNSYPNRNNMPIESKSHLFAAKLNDTFKDIEQSNENMVDITIPYGKILDSDDRTQIMNPKVWPYIAVARIYTVYHNVLNQVDGKNHTLRFVGTGFLAGPNLLVTAGHCVYGDVSKESSGGKDFEDNIDNPRFPDEVMVYAGLNGYGEKSTSYAYYAEASIINIKKEYYESPSFDHDWSAVQLDRDLGNITGYFDKICDWYSENHSVYSYGYPGDKPDTMWETYGNLIGNSTYNYYYNLDTVGGQSGSPVFMVDDNGKAYVCGIHTLGTPTYNGGTIINSFIYHYLNSFIRYHNYEHKVGTIAPTDYGFANSYPTNDYLRNNFVSHNTSSGFKFETRRYRTGYINNEYIVMSPFRKNIMEAFIEYRFSLPVSKIEVDLAHWRELYKEWTYSSECDAVVRCKLFNFNIPVFDLLSDSTNLPTDRTHPTTYVIWFPIPVYSFEFYMHSKMQHSNDNNRGRICIGNMTVYSKEGA